MPLSTGGPAGNELQTLERGRLKVHPGKSINGPMGGRTAAKKKGSSGRARRVGRNSKGKREG